MKAITLRPAWAWAVIFGGKSVENRAWNTSHRGPLAIHAGQAGPNDADDVEAVEKIIGRRMPDEIDFGAVIGVVDLLDVWTPRQVGARYVDAAKWSRGPFCWVLANPRELIPPVDCHGRLGLWEFPETRAKKTVDSATPHTL